MTFTAPSETRLKQDVQAHRGLFTALGVALIVLGVFSFIATFAFTVASVLILGIFLIIGGIAQIVEAARGRTHGNTALTVAAGILYIIAGALFLYHPVVAAMSLTLVLSVFLVVVGIIRVFHAFSHRNFENWGWWAASGVLDIVLGGIIWAQWPVSGLWVLGLFIGIDMIFSGATWIAIANSDRRAITQTSEPKTPTMRPSGS